MNTGKRTLGSAIFTDIDSNAYLGKLYARLLKGYGMHVFNIGQSQQAGLFTSKEKSDILRFADILSKSNDPAKAEARSAAAKRMWETRRALKEAAT